MPGARRPPGPPPKPLETRALEGRSVSHMNHPKPVKLAPAVEAIDMREPPDDLPAEGKELWRTVMPWLVQANVVQLVDLPSVKTMCAHYAQMERARRVLDEDGYFVLGSMGQMTEHPSMRIFNNASDKFLRYAQEFGLTTIARTRMGLMEVQRASIAQEMNWTIGPGSRGKQRVVDVP
jgi:P27 family predicted phage terminase small subunit